MPKSPSGVPVAVASQHSVVYTVRMATRKLPATRDILIFSIGVLLALAGVRLATSPVFEQTPLSADEAALNIQWLPASVERWSSYYREYGAAYDVNPELIAIITTVESGGDPQAVSEAGAVGLMQVTPTTAGDIARRYLKQPRQEYDLKDPRTNIEFGTAYLAMLRDEFGEARHGPDWNTTVEYVAAGYNGGGATAGALYRGEGLRDTEPVVYSRDVYNMWRERRSSASPTFERWLERGGSALVKQAASRQ